MMRGRRQRGVTLIGLMIGLAVGLLVLSATLQAYMMISEGARDTLREARLDQELRAALDVIRLDIRRAGYWADPDPDPLANPFQRRYGRINNDLCVDTASDTGRSAAFRPRHPAHAPPHANARGQTMNAFHRASLLGAAAVLAGCASVAPDGLRGDVAALTAGRTGGTEAALPATDPTARTQAQQSINDWLAQPITQDTAVRIALLNNPGLHARLAALGEAVANGRVERGHLGVTIQPVTAELAEAFGLKGKNGALIAEVAPGAPAEEAGLQAGDVILEIDGKKVEGSADLRLMVSKMAPGSQVTAIVLRDGKEKKFEIRIGSLSKAQNSAPALNGAASALAGLQVQDLDRNLRQRLGIPPRLSGALIAGIEPNSPAARTGLEPGDVIFEINRQPVKSAQEFLEAAKAGEGRRLLLRVWNRGTIRYLVFE